MNEKEFTHFDAHGNAIMVDVGEKEITSRMALAKGSITLNAKTLAAIQNGTTKKGDVLGIARIAGIMAAKQTANLIPLCHPLLFETCTIDFKVPQAEAENAHIEASCLVRLSGKTGAEMEALTGVSVALLTIYDMCKALERGMVITGIHLEEKSGGKSGHFRYG
ncbi:MAG: cyclic pyranopterin monophosphate synthase MoaC [Termitinemataceae bacterium]|nr:MAG: cyclic pyranopterin monophosphate synthase MoaC [Termitinemataceae bacterium]